MLLSVCQTCKYMGVDFLDFLRSGEKDIHAFAESRRGRRRRSPTANRKRCHRMRRRLPFRTPAILRDFCASRISV